MKKRRPKTQAAAPAVTTFATQLKLIPSSSGVALYPAGAAFGPRVMRDYEFVWMIEGDAEYRWGEQTFAAPEGSIVLCRPGATDAFRWDPLKRTRHGFYHFQIPAIPHGWPVPDTWPLVRTPEDADTLRPLFRHVLTWWGKGRDELRQLSMAHMLTAYVFNETGTGDIPRESLHDAVERALVYVDTRLDENPAAKITLAELAGAAYVTSEHLCRLFKAHTGYSPVETLRLARLDRAALLLWRSNYAVQEIAEQCGFANPFHFSRQFKQAFGKSPREMHEFVQGGGFVPMSRLVRVLKPGLKFGYVGRQ